MITARRTPDTAYSESAQLQNVKVDGQSQHQGRAKKRMKIKNNSKSSANVENRFLSMHSHCISYCRRLSKNILSKLFG